MKFEYYDKCMKGFKNYDTFSDKEKHLLFEIVRAKIEV